MKTSDLKKNENLHLLVYGPSGGGKTHLIGEFAKAGPVWVNDTDFGIETLAGYDDIEYERYYERVGVRKPAEWSKLMKFIDEQIAEPQYKTYAFDSLTTHCDVCAADVVGTVNAGMEIIQLQHYQTIYARLTTFMTKIRKLDANVILTAHEDISRDAKGRRVVQPLVLGEKMAARIPIFWNNIYHISVEPAATANAEPKRSLLVQSDGEKIAKSNGDPEDVTIDPTYEAIMAHFGK
jgi:hypothetical protein